MAKNTSSPAPAHSLPVETITIDPRAVRLLDLNARYMTHEQFQRLVQNIRRDGALTSVPFGWLVRDDGTELPMIDDAGNEVIEVLSGNHRVQAAIEAGLATIPMLITRQYIAPDRRRAIQLSHNEITGQDDPAILRIIYSSIDDIEWRVYTGHDDQKLGLLVEPPSLPSIREANLQYQRVTMLFLPEELEEIKAIWDEAQLVAAGSKALYLAHLQQYDQMLEGLEIISRVTGIKNVATAVGLMLRIFRANMHALDDDWLDQHGEPLRAKDRVPVDVVFEWPFITARAAARLRKVVDKLLSEKAITKDRKFDALEHLLDAWDRDQSNRGT